MGSRLATYDLAVEAGSLLRLLTQHTDVNAVAVAELQASGVGPGVIANLYPFALDAHLPAIAATLRERKGLIVATSALKVSSATTSLDALPTPLRYQMHQHLWAFCSEMPELPPGHRSLAIRWLALILFLHTCAELPPGHHGELAYGSLLGQRLRAHVHEVNLLQNYLSHRARAGGVIVPAF